MLRDIYLHGALGKQFGRHFRLDIDSPAEAVRALCSQIRGLKEAIRHGEFRVSRGRYRMDETELSMGLGKSSLHVTPVPVGSKSNGVFKVILGVALLGIGFAVGASASLFGISGLTGSTLITMGAGMALNGVAQLLSPSAEATSSESAETRQSYIFGGPQNCAAEGNCIPVAYGTCWCGSLVLSAGLDVLQVESDDA